MKSNNDTFGRWMGDPEIKEAYRKEKPHFLLSELLSELMAEKGVSVRKLAEESGLSPTTIQKIKSGESTNVRFKNVFGLLKSFGYSLVAEKKKKRIVFTD